MAVIAEHPVRFLVFPHQKEFLLSFPLTTTVQKVKEYLVAQWPSGVDISAINLSLPSQIRLIFSGKVLQDNATIEDVLGSCNDNSSPITIHLVLRSLTSEEAAQLEAQATQGEQPTQEEEFEPDWGRGIHFHGCTFNEEELAQLRSVFAKKQDENKTMSFTDVHAFLRSYWRWMKANKHKEENEEFPMETMMSVKHRVIGRNQRLSLDEFLRIFFLFDNRTPCENCPHGEKPRAQRATEELHKTLKPNSDFCNDIFNRVFASIDKDNDNLLTCQEVELLFYMYSATVLEQETV